MKQTCKFLIELDTESDQAIYLQLRDRIICGIASSEIAEGDCLPSVRCLADQIGVNMHTVNKAYALLAEEGYLAVERCRGAVVVRNADREKALAALREKLRVAIAEAVCADISGEEVCRIVRELYGQFE